MHAPAVILLRIQLGENVAARLNRSSFPHGKGPLQELPLLADPLDGNRS